MVIDNQIFNHYRKNKVSIDKELNQVDAKTLLKQNFIRYLKFLKKLGFQSIT